MLQKNAALPYLLVPLLILQVACAGKKVQAPPAIVPPTVTVTVAPATIELKTGTTQSFTATVVNDDNNHVIWSVQDVGGGSIDASGLYTAPADPGTFTILATSVARPDVHGTAQVTVTKDTPIPVVVTVAPKDVQLQVNGAQLFTATVTGSTNTRVTWTVTEKDGGDIESTGTYHAVTVAGTYHVVATSDADPTKSDTATITVTALPPPIKVTVDPPTATLITGKTQAFTATVLNTTNTAVTWSVTEPGGGTVDGNGLYTAPSKAGSFTVVAQSVADPTRSGSATVTVQEVAITISPKQADMHPGDSTTFTATVTGTQDTTAKWSVQEAGGGTIDSAGKYTAPATVGTYHVVVSATADPSKTASAAVTVAAPVFVDPSGILGNDRATKWEPGLMAKGGIPDRQQVCKTVKPGNGDDTAAIQDAVDACPKGQVVALAEGTFTINGGNYVLINKGITLRGAGPDKTILQKTDGAKPGDEATGANPSPLLIVGPSRWPADSNTHVNLTQDAGKGDETATVNDAKGFKAGQIVLLDELSGATWQDDPGGRGQILAASDWRVVWQRHNPDQQTDDPVSFDGTTIGNGQDAPSWFSRQDRVTAEMKRIKAINGQVITFETPLHISYRFSHKAQLTVFDQDPPVEQAGIEDLAVIGGDNGNIRFERAAESWVRGVENSVWHDEGFALDQSYRIEIREFYVHDGAWAQPGGAGYAISLANGTAEALIENGISVRANKVIVARASGAGSVVGYNYLDMGYINSNGAWIEVGLNASHMVGPHHVLFEGNYAFNADSDKTHGNSIYHTYFRNYLPGVRTPFHNQSGGQLIDDAASQDDGPKRCAGLGFYSYWMSFVGNVMGVPGDMSGWKYETTFGGGDPGVWMLGWDDWDPYPVDAKVAQTTIRHGNFDYLTNKVHWDPTIETQDLPDSLYLSGKPAFFDAGKGYTWPWVQPTDASKQVLVLPAKARYDAGTPFTQP